MDSSLLPPMLQTSVVPTTPKPTIPGAPAPNTKRSREPQPVIDTKRQKLNDLPPATLKLDDDHAAALQSCYDLSDTLPRNSKDKFSMFNLRKILGDCPSMDDFEQTLGHI